MYLYNIQMLHTALCKIRAFALPGVLNVTNQSCAVESAPRTIQGYVHNRISGMVAGREQRGCTPEVIGIMVHVALGRASRRRTAVIPITYSVDLALGGRGRTP